MAKFESSWNCPSNIALVKYWGKLEEQLPMNPSISFSLQNSTTQTSIKVIEKGATWIQFLFEGQQSLFLPRIEKYFERVAKKYSWIKEYSFQIESKNTFPHSAGIASSASAFGALALCLVDLNQQITGVRLSKEKLLQEASFWARIGSGSACRSVYGGFNWWGASEVVNASSSQFAINVSETIHPSYFKLCDAVLLVDSGEKKVSSSAGHQLMNSHIYKDARLDQANQTGRKILSMMSEAGREFEFLNLVEQEALSLHAMMMTSNPSFVLLKPNSLEIIEKIRNYRESTGIPIGFTIDAGPNIHLLYWKNNKTEVHQFIETELLALTSNQRWLDDEIGEGPIQL